MKFMVALIKVGRALLPTCTFPSTAKFSNLMSIFGISIPTLEFIFLFLKNKK